MEPSDLRVEVHLGGRRIADSTRAVRVLETSHPPVWYVPLEDVDRDVLHPSRRSTYCEFKGRAVYWDVRVGERLAQAAAWSYPEPAPGYELLRDRLAFYPQRVDECRVGGERVRAQEGDFYGGWITSNVAGPFKGGPGTAGW